MDLVDGMTTEEAAHEAARETRRAELVRSIQDLPKAREIYDKAVAVVRKLEDAEKTRRAKAQKAIQAAREVADKEHRWVQHCAECDSFLLSEYVPKETLTARDKARAALNAASRALRVAEGLAGSQKDRIERKSQRTILAYKTDKKTGKRVESKVPNPQKWQNKDAKIYAQKVLEEFEIARDEAAIEAERANKVYTATEVALSAAIEAARRG